MVPKALTDENKVQVPYLVGLVLKRLFFKHSKNNYLPKEVNRTTPDLKGTYWCRYVSLLMYIFRLPFGSVAPRLHACYGRVKGSQTLNSLTFLIGDSSGIPCSGPRVSLLDFPLPSLSFGSQSLSFPGSDHCCYTIIYLSLIHI